MKTKEKFSHASLRDRGTETIFKISPELSVFDEKVMSWKKSIPEPHLT